MSSQPVHLSMFTPQVTPPAQGPLRQHTHTYDLMRQCIHCGFCLPTCPTYAVLGVEMDSPRGRIYQMQAVADGRLEVTDDFIAHMDCCLGCRACETACPSGVQFGKLIEAAREHIQLEETARPTHEVISTGTGEHASDTTSSRTPALTALTMKLLRRFFFDIMLPSRLVTSLIFGGLKVYQRSGIQTLVHKTGLFNLINALPTPFQGKFKVPEALMTGATGPLLPARLPEVTEAIGPRRYRVGIVAGCIMDQVFRDINEATIRVLTANGCEVISPLAQQCCGALHVHGGEAEHGRALARHNIDVFEQFDCDAIVINSAGCGSTLKEYDHLLRDDPAYAERARAFSAKVKDISEFLQATGLNREMGTVAHTVAYHDACHLAHGQKIKQQPRQMLRAIPGLTMVDLKEADWCCGSAGIYNITNQEMAAELLERKMQNIIATRADVIATGNPGCMMQIAMGARERGLPLKIMHPVQLLDEAYAAAGRYTVPAPVDSARQWQQAERLLAGVGLVALLGALLLRRRKR